MSHRRRRVLLRARTALLCALAFLASAGAQARDKVDVITLTNGDRVTCEIRNLSLGLLVVKTDAMGTVEVEWVKVKAVDSPQLFEVETQDGYKYYGAIASVERDGRFRVVEPRGEVVTLGHDEVVRIAQMQQSWRDRWGGHVDLGYSYTSAAKSTQFSLGAEAVYRTRRLQMKTTLNSIISDRAEVERTSWSSFATTYERFLPKRYIWIGTVRIEQNEELKLDYRASVGGGFGRYLVQGTRSQLGMLVGAAVNQERYLGTDSTDQTAEGLIAVTYDLFVYGSRETTFSNSLRILPSLSQSGRYRLELSSSLRRKMVKDFTLSVSAYESYDSDPPSQDSQKSDLRFTTNLGWTF